MGNYVSFKCANCGSVFLDEIEEGKKLRCRHCKCEYLREVETDEQRNARIKYISELNDAEKHLRISPPDFDKAESLFRDFINEYSNRYEGYWGLVRARYGIKYELDTNRKEVPSCYKSSYEDFRNDSYFKKALELATHSIIYNDLKDKADLIADVCKEWREEAKKYSYDIFISFKDENDELSISDEDRKEMNNLYEYLVDEGYNVFFSPRTLRKITGKHYDPYIFNALQTAKAMIVYGSKPEYFSMTWVQNEWTRFLRMQAKGEKKKGSCIVAYNGFNPRELPFELRGIQAIDASKNNRFFYPDILKAIKEVFKEEKKVDSNEELMRKIAELERKQAEEKKEEQRRQEELQKKLEESKKQQEALEKSLEEEKKKNSKKPNTISEEARTPETAATTKVNQATKMAEVFDPDFEIVDGCLKKYKGKKAEVLIPDGVVEIGERAFYVPEYYPAIVKSIVIPRSVKTIGSYAFGNVHGLTSITLPDSIKTINSYAFNNCSGLTSITIPDSVTSIGSHTFDGCSNLKSITIGNSVTSIGENAFANCKNLIDIIIPNSVTNIGNDAFQWCKNLKSITIPDSIKTIGKYAFSGCSSLSQIEISNYIKTIGEGTFAWCSSLTDFVIPDSVKTIGVAAFTGCNNLKNISIPNSVTTLGNSAFSKCDSLNDVIIPNSVKLIGSFAFSECTGLTSIVIPKSVTNIGSNAFSHCDSLTILVDDLEQTEKWTANWNPDNRPVKVIEKAASVVAGKTSSSKTNVTPTAAVAKKEVSKSDPDFEIVDGCLKRYKGKKAEVVIPKEVTSIGWDAFSDCSSLTSITIPDSVTSIGWDAFDGTAYYNDESNWVDGVLYIGNHLIEAKDTISGEYVIKDGTVTIADNAFYDCDSLTSVTIPDSVTSIGNDAFDGTAYYNDESNWANGVLYIGNHLIKAKDSISGEYVIKDGTVTIADIAFYDCDSLTSITIPDSVTSIGEDAFEGCSSLTIYVNNLEQTKKWDPKWNPDNRPVKVIEKAAKVVTGKASSPKVGVTPTAAIAKKEASKSDPDFEIKDGCLVKYKGNKAEVVIPDGVTSIGEKAFEECKTIKTLTIPNGVTCIDKMAFYECYYLANVVIPKSVTCIGEGAFNACARLTDLEIPNSVTKIGDFAFSECNTLTEVVIPNSVTTIGEAAFSDCENLSKISIPSSVESIGNEAFARCCFNNIIVDQNNKYYKSVNGSLYNKNGTMLIQYAIGKENSTFEIPNGVKHISSSAFCWCENITSVVISHGVTSIGDYAFKNCNNLASITIPDSVTSIGEEAFYNTAYYSNESNWVDGVLYSCNHLIDAKNTISGEYVIKDGTVTIADNAFSWCENLSEVTIPESVTFVGSDAFFKFSKCKSLTIWVSDLEQTKKWDPNWNPGNLPVKVKKSIFKNIGKFFRNINNKNDT